MKRILPLLSILILLISCDREKECSYIGDYYQLVYSAEEAYYKEDFQKVFDNMSKAASKCELLNQRGINEMLKYAESAARIGKDEKALELVRELILKGYKIDQLRNNQAFSKYTTTSEWKQIEEDFPKLHKEYLNSINLDLRKQISEMTYKDQYHRSMLGTEGINRDSVWRMINKTDSINDLKLKSIIKKYGYPDQRIIGGYNIDMQPVDPGILLFHFHDYDYYTKTLKKLIDNGEAPPQSLGNFVDSYQRRVPDEKKFIYGIYDNAGEDQIIDYENLDERRVAIGLPPMKLKRSIESLKRAYYGY